jgi:hypothetical protein
MTGDWWLPALAGLLVVVAAALTVTLLRLRARTRHELAAARAEAAELRKSLTALERRMDERPAVGSDPEFRITNLGDPEPEAPDPPPMDRQMFTDLLLRESVVRVGSLAYGVRRALRPEVRNRIRFEVRREVKRSRKLRKDEVREAVREWRARQRDDPAADDLRNSA